MADAHERAVELAEHLLERRARGEVEVVGRLVQREPGDALEHQQGERHARALAARERRDGLLDLRAAEQEAREVRADLQVGHGRVRAAHEVVGRALGVELGRVLVVVAGRAAWPRRQRARQRRLAAGEDAQQRASCPRRSAPTMPMRSPRPMRRSRPCEERARAVAAGEAAAPRAPARRRARPAAGRSSAGARRGAAARRRTTLSSLFWRPLASAVRWLPMCFLMKVSSLRMTSCCCSHARSSAVKRSRVSSRYFGVVARVALQHAALELEDRVDRAVEQAAVVADDQHGALRARQPGLDPLDALEVEVVGGLVEQEEVVAGDELARQRHAAAFAARERARLALPEGREEARCPRAPSRRAARSPSRRRARAPRSAPRAGAGPARARRAGARRGARRAPRARAPGPAPPPGRPRRRRAR